MSLPFKYLPRPSAAYNFAWRTFGLYASNRSLKAYAAVAWHFWRRLRGRPTPTYVTLAVTYRCQCRCDHCYADYPERARKEELSTEQWRTVIRQVRDLGALTVHFSGGEPLLREDLFELIAYARGLGLLTRVNSNGLLLTEENVKHLKEVGLTECAVSLDSADPEVHDRFRGTPNLHARAAEGMRNLQRHGVPCRLLTVASRESIPDGLAASMALGRELGARYTYILVPIAVGAWNEDYDVVLTAEERKRIRDMQTLTFAHLELPTRQTECCVYRKAILYVSVNGDVTPCAFVPYVLGNVTETPLPVIWQRHCGALKSSCRDDCPMNDPEKREALRAHVAGVAAAWDHLQSGTGPGPKTARHT